MSRTCCGALVALNVCLLGVVSAARQGTLDPAPPMAENVFKNIQVLKGIPADEFMDTMGMFASSLLFDCTGCHDQKILTDRQAFAITTPRITRARQMVAMVTNLNRNFFAGQPRVTCFTCHRGSSTPEVVPDLDLQYGSGPGERPNAMTIFPDRTAKADQVFSRYIQAVGGAARVAALTSFVAKGTYTGFNTSDMKVPIEIFAKAPDQRTTVVEMFDGEAVKTFDGRNAWAALTSFVAKGTYTGFNTSDMKVPIEIFAKAPDQRTTVVQMFDGEAVKTFDGRNAWAAEEWRQLPLMTFTGSNVAGARFEAIVSFPAGIQKAFGQWQVSSTLIKDREVQILQGTNPGQLPVNLYFDESGLLVRSVRWNSTPVGTVPTQTDYADYRDVAGVKVPFRWEVTWTNGQNTIELSEVRPNVAIAAARFAKPAPFKPR